MNELSITFDLECIREIKGKFVSTRIISLKPNFTAEERLRNEIQEKMEEMKRKHCV